MKKLSASLFFTGFAAILLASLPSFGQAYSGSVLQNSPGNYARVVPFGQVEVCPGTDTNTPCASFANTYTDATLVTACAKSSTSGVLSGAPTSGTGCNNPGIADANGNFQLYLNPVTGNGAYRICTFAQNWICQNITVGSGGSGGGSALIAMLSPQILTPPVLSALTWGNQASATAVYNTGGGLHISSPGVSPNGISALFKNTPATPWTLTIGIVPGDGASSSNRNEAGLMLRESSTGKILWIPVGTNSGGSAPLIIGDRLTGFTSSGTLAFTGYNLWPSPVAWLQATDDGTNVTISISIDGQTFKPIYQESVTASFTSGPNQAGIGINVQTTSTSVITDGLFVYWAGI